MHRRSLLLVTVLAVLMYSSNAFAGVWLELLNAPCWTGNPNDIIGDNGVIGRYRGAVDCFNKDFNGGPARTVLSIKAFQAWEYGSVFLYYDVTGPFNSPAAHVSSVNELGGFFGGTTIAVSPKKIYEKISGKPLNLGFLADVSVKYEMEHVSKFGMLHYYGLQWDLIVPFMDFVTVTTVIRNDPSFDGIDFQLGAAWQKSFSIGDQDFLFLGFFQWGLFGEGDGHGLNQGVHGEPFFMSQPELLYDLGKLARFTPGKFYIGFEGQIAYNRYLVPGKIENLIQGMIRWNI